MYDTNDMLNKGLNGGAKTAKTSSKNTSSKNSKTINDNYIDNNII